LKIAPFRKIRPDYCAIIGRWAQRAPLGVSMKKQLNEMRAIDDRRCFGLQQQLQPLPVGETGVASEKGLPQQAGNNTLATERQ
jgi:hypothetical protein